MPLVNLTQHEVVVFDSKGEVILLRIPPSGTVARVAESDVTNGMDFIEGIPVVRKDYGKVLGIPEVISEENTYIVSMLVLQTLQLKGNSDDYRDLVSPDTGTGAVRNDRGQIIGTTQFVSL